ncbi:MAG: Clp1/GlmU family protein [Anaerolineae bacterium]
MDRPLHIPPRWKDLDPTALGERILLLGATDSGKSTFARYLVHRLLEAGLRPAYLDCDIGQSTLGLPTTMNLAVPSGPLPTAEEDLLFPPQPGASFFVGSITPRGHMLPLLVGCQRLLERAQELEARPVVVDTTGLVDPAQGGLALKQWKVELVRPQTVVALVKGRELEPILWPLRLAEGTRVVELPVSPEARPRDRAERIARRQRLLNRYFHGAGLLSFPLGQRPIFDLHRAAAGRLVGLQDARGFTLALGVVERLDRETGILWVRTPLQDARSVASLRIGTCWLQQGNAPAAFPARPRPQHPGHFR